MTGLWSLSVCVGGDFPQLSDTRPEVRELGRGPDSSQALARPQTPEPPAYLLGWGRRGLCTIAIGQVRECWGEPGVSFSHRYERISQNGAACPSFSLGPQEREPSWLGLAFQAPGPRAQLTPLALRVLACVASATNSWVCLRLLVSEPLGLCLFCLLSL